MLFDSFGSFPIFITLLKDFPILKQQKIILRECVLALITLFIFITCGRSFFHFLNIPTYAFQLLGGIMLLSVAFNMLCSAPKAAVNTVRQADEPFFFPLAFPVITGPAVITTILSFLEEGLYSRIILLDAIIIAWFLSTLVLVFSSFLNKCIGYYGLIALERVFSVALLLMSGNLILKGISIAFNLGFYIR